MVFAIEQWSFGIYVTTPIFITKVKKKIHIRKNTTINETVECIINNDSLVLIYYVFAVGVVECRI